MILPKEAVLEYQQIYKDQFGTEISYDEALKQGTELINLLKIVYRPIPESRMSVVGSDNRARRELR